jgi:K+-sensing histidine kinase KdpD
MGRTAGRLFLILVAVALPPLVAFATVDALAGDLVARFGAGTSLVVAAAATIVWAAMLAVTASRVLGSETRRMVELAERGMAQPAAADDAASGELRLMTALDERNRQIAALAAQVRDAPISLDASAVARSMVDAARSITGDPTWSLAVMRSKGDRILSAGVYDADAELRPISDVHLWAATLEVVPGEVQGVRFADGPWGAFAVAEVAASEELHAVLIAPWEGRNAPSRAERELLGLIGQHAGMAIEHALLYARVREQAEELDRLARLQSDFLRGVSHDLQTPLTSIRALAQEIQATRDVPGQVHGDLDAIAFQADRLRRMVAQLLAMSRLESGVLNPRSDVFRVEPIIERTWTALRADRPFELVVHGEPHLAIGDPDRFEQALWAILDNAVKYSPAGSTVRADVTPVAGALHVTVDDEGTGMDAETRRQAFDQFFRAANARETVPDGSGIGLFTARGLLRAMGGDLSAGEGTRSGASLRMVLPAEPATGA